MERRSTILFHLEPSASCEREISEEFLSGVCLKLDADLSFVEGKVLRTDRSFSSRARWLSACPSVQVRSRNCLLRGRDL
jgi:hypothetical protein